MRNALVAGDVSYGDGAAKAIGPDRVGVTGFRVERVSPCFVYLQGRGAVDVDRGEWRRFRGDRGEGTSCFFVEEHILDLFSFSSLFLFRFVRCEL